MIREKSPAAAFASIVIITAALAGCSDPDGGWTLRDSYARAVTLDGGRVYAGGYLQANNNFNQTIWTTRACVWTDGTALVLPQDGGARVSSVCVAGGVLYAAGYCIQGGRQLAGYWAGTVFHDVTPPTVTSAVAYGVCASSGTLYVAGICVDSATGADTPFVSTASLGGGPPSFTYLSLPAGAVSGAVRGVAVVAGSPDRVCLAGYYYSGTNCGACSWRDGVRTDYSETPSQAFAVCADAAGDFSVAGTRAGPAGGTYVCVWKNGTVSDVETGAACTPSVNSICVSGGDVYVAGWYQGVSYWKGTARTDLLPSGVNEATGIFVSGGTVYVSGSYSPAGHGLRACCWTVSGGSASGPIELPVDFH